MKVAFSTWKFPALPNTFILNEVVEVIKRGHDVSIYSIDRSDDDVFHDDVARFDLLAKTHVLNDFVARPGMLRRNEFARYTEDWLREKVHALRPIARHMEKEGVELIHGCFANNSATVAMVASRLTGIPFTFECHAHDLFVDLRYAREKIEQTQRIFAISDYNRRFLIDELGCSPEKVVIRRVPILKEYCDGIASGERQDGLVVFVGRLHAIKGLGDAIDAFHRVAARMPQARFLIIGDGELRQTLTDQVQALGLGDKVRFTGSLTNQESLAHVSRASVFLLPSVIDDRGDRDGIPTSLIEAMYLRTPAVSTRVSGIPELIDDGENGLLAEPGDVEAIAAGLERLLGDASLRERLGQSARAKVDAEFDVGRNIDILIDHWRAIVDSRPKPGWLASLRRRVLS